MDSIKDKVPSSILADNYELNSLLTVIDELQRYKLGAITEYRKLSMPNAVTDAKILRRFLDDLGIEHYAGLDNNNLVALLYNAQAILSGKGTVGSLKTLLNCYCLMGGVYPSSITVSTLVRGKQPILLNDDFALDYLPEGADIRDELNPAVGSLPVAVPTLIGESWYENLDRITIDIVTTYTPDDQFYSFLKKVIGNYLPMVGTDFSMLTLSMTGWPSPADITLTVAANNANFGSIAIYPKRDKYMLGETVMLHALPKSGYKFARWVNSALEGATPMVKLDFDTSLVAEFVAVSDPVESLKLVTVNTNIPESATIVLTPNTVRMAIGQQVTASLTPKDGFIFQKWSDDNTSQLRSFTVSGDVSLTAIMVKQASLALSKNSIAFGAIRGTNSFIIITPCKWSLSTAPSWLKMSHQFGEGTTTVTLTVLESNLTNEKRSATITVATLDGDSIKQETITVTQEAFVKAAFVVESAEVSNSTESYLMRVLTNAPKLAILIIAGETFSTIGGFSSGTFANGVLTLGEAVKDTAAEVTFTVTFGQNTSIIDRGIAVVADAVGYNISSKFSIKQLKAPVTYTTTSIGIAPTTLSVLKGATAKLVYSITPSNSTDAISYSTSNAAVATVDQDGTVHGIGDGTCTITVTAGEKSASAQVTVATTATVSIIATTPLEVSGIGFATADIISVNSNTAITLSCPWWIYLTDGVNFYDNNAVIPPMVGTLNIVVDNNPKYQVRTGNIVLTYSGGSQTIVVKQGASTMDDSDIANNKDNFVPLA